MLGDPFELQFSIVKVDQVGSGEMIRVSMYPGQGNLKVTMKRLPLYYPDLLSQSSKSQLCGSIGSLTVFKQSQHANGCDLPKADREDEYSLPVKWFVLLPELSISRTFLEEPKCTLEKFTTRRRSSLNQLDELTRASK